MSKARAALTRRSIHITQAIAMALAGLSYTLVSYARTHHVKSLRSVRRAAWDKQDKLVDQLVKTQKEAKEVALAYDRLIAKQQEGIGIVTNKAAHVDIAVRHEAESYGLSL